MSTGTNGIDPQKAQRWLGEVLRVHDALDEQKIANMNECRTIRARLAPLYEAAKNEGLPARAFKASVKKALFERQKDRLDGRIADLKPEDEDDAAAYEMLQEALGGFGDTPLGAATLDAAADKREKAAARKAAKAAKADAAGQEAEGTAATEADHVAANTAALEKGIGQLESDTEFDDSTSSKPSRKRAASLEGADAPGSYKIN